MAFSKAKLLRFNDIKSCAPPPGAYNPKYNDPVVGAVIPTCDRFLEPKSPATSTCSESQSVCSMNSMPTFRTPTKPVLRKKILPNSADKKKSSKNLFSPKKSEALREKIVECMNKDMTIRELETQIEDMKATINKLKTEQDKINSEKEGLLEELEKVKKLKEDEMNELKKMYDEEIVKLKEEFSNSEAESRKSEDSYKKMVEELKTQNDVEMNELKENIYLLEKVLETSVGDREQRLKSIEDKLTESEALCTALQSELFLKNKELKILQDQIQESKEAQIELEKNHTSEIISLNKLHESEVQDLEYELLKTATEWRKIVEDLKHESKKRAEEMNHQRQIELNMLQENCGQQILMIKEETEAQIKQVNENCNEKVKLAEIQMEEKRKELEADWAMKLRKQHEKAEEILKECQSISEYSIIQCELEKNDIANRFRQENDEVRSENTQLQDLIKNLKAEMSGVIIELNDTRDQLGKEIESHENDIKVSQIEMHSYEVTLNKTHETINALKDRLLNSDRDVEQLSSEIEQIEMNSLSNENKIIELETQLEETTSTNEALKTENQHLKNELETTVKSVEQQLHQKVDEFRTKSELKIQELTKTLLVKSERLAEVMDQLHDQQATIVEAQNLIGNAEKELDTMKSKNNSLESKLSSQEKINCCQQSKIEELMKLLAKKDEEIEALKKAIKEQNALIGPFREQLEHYERDYKMLLNNKNNVEQEMKEVSLKYAEILGHQNKKQKIKYMVDLKKKNLELQESKSDYEAKLFKQTLLIDNLRYEIKTLQQKNDKRQKRRSRSLIASEDKENICSPVKAQINSPFKIDSPLKDRN